MYLYLFQKHGIEDIFQKDINYELYITHDYGGGTHTYECNYVSNNSNLIILRNISYGKDFLFAIENPFLQKKTYILPNKLGVFLKNNDFLSITVNSSVKNLSFGAMVNFLAEKYNENKIYIKVNVHDLQCICPNHHLIVGNQYCNVECDKNNCAFDRLFVRKNIAIYEWRKTWEYLFSFVSEIVCFSLSSKDVIQRVYPNTDKKINVIPHSMAYCNFNPVDTKGFKFHIGIIGAITTAAKGLVVVKDFLKYTSKKQIKVSVIGKMHLRDRVYSSCISYCGSYKNEELQSLIEHKQITNIFFPSICPETFSYLISELTAMSLPIVCFDVGAQAEKIKNYNKGYICHTTDPENILVLLKKQYIENQ